MSAVTRTTVLDFVRSLGCDPKRVQAVTVEPTRITVTEYLQDDQGAPVMRDGQRATATTTIGIQ